jgi:hypothetical protein
MDPRKMDRNGDRDDILTDIVYAVHDVVKNQVMLVLLLQHTIIVIYSEIVKIYLLFFLNLSRKKPVSICQHNSKLN